MRRIVVARRGLRLAVGVHFHSRLKFLLLALLIAISISVFLGVNELSRASTANLTEAIEGDLGVAGTYRVEPSPDLGLSRAELMTVMRTVAATFTSKPIQVALRFPTLHPECPPYDELGNVSSAVLLDSHGDPKVFAAGELRSSAADLCLAGLVVPRASLREATPYERSNFDASIVVEPIYASLLELSDAQPDRYLIVITTARDEDQSAELKAAMEQALSPLAIRAGLRPSDAVVVTRADSGTQIRSASRGIQTVYALIGWGVLAVGGIGILVAELIVLRDRTWFFGLARAVGARRLTIAWLVLADILIVLVAGTALALVVLATTAPWVAEFGRAAFQSDIHLLRRATVPGLLGGVGFILVIGGAYPAWRATRLDPMDVLERR